MKHLKTATFLILLVSLLGLVSCDRLNPYEPRLEVAGVSLALDSSGESSFRIKNDGETGSVLLWKTVPNSRTASTEPASGRLEAGATEAVNIVINNAGLRQGQVVKTSVKIESNGGNATISVDFTMTKDGLLACGSYPKEASAPGTKANRETTETEPANDTLPYVADELLVQYRSSDVPQSAASPLSLKQIEARVAADFALSVLEPASAERPALVKIGSHESVTEVAARLAQDPRVAYAEPNYYLELLEHSSPNDPLYNEQWHLQNFGLPEAWDLETGESDVVIAVIDSGVDRLHEDLAAKLLPGCDLLDQDPDPAGPEVGHGTHVSGIAAASGNNRTGVAGVAYGSGVKIVPVKIFGDSGKDGTLNDLFDAMLWASGVRLDGVGANRYPADIINMSLGVPNKLSAETLQSVDDVAKQLYDRGVILIAASGNDGLNNRIYAPASSPWVFGVGSVTSAYRRSSFSNYASTAPTVDFMAPGGELSECGLSGILSTYLDDSYSCLAGTSMASPFVAGVVALLLSQNPDLGPKEVKEKLSSSALFDATFMTREAYGAGIVCADRALGAASLCGR